MIVGTWKITSTAVDTNHNGTLDANETFSSDTAWAHETYVFSSSGTITYTHYSDVEHANYQFLNNNTLMKVTLTDGPGNGETLNWTIVTLNSTTFTSKDTTGGQLHSTTFTKQ